jgi:hypothetical protein
MTRVKGGDQYHSQLYGDENGATTPPSQLYGGRPSGDAWISFATVEEASRAVMQRNKQHLGNRYIELFQQD